MDLLRDYYDWRPSYDQELLLKAALLKGLPAKQSWEELSKDFDISILDYGSQRLLPLLSHNLKTNQINNPFSSQLRKLYVDTWAKNQILFGRISPLLESLHEVGISTLVLKGASLIVSYYKNFGLRPMSDFDFLVPTDQAYEAISLLRQQGWNPQLKSPDRSLVSYLSVNYAIHFSNPAKCDLDLHWHVFGACLAADADLDFWEDAVPIEINGIHTLALNPTDTLFHTCIHGVRWNKMAPIRWVADAVIILNSAEKIDWDRLFAQAKKRHLTLPLKDALTYLKDHLDVEIQPEFLENLNRIPVSNLEIREHRTRTKRPGWSSYIPFLWANYPRIALDTGRSSNLLGFIEYLQAFWELDYIWQVPFYAALRSLNRLFGIRSE